MDVFNLPAVAAAADASAHQAGLINVIKHLLRRTSTRYTCPPNSASNRSFLKKNASQAAEMGRFPQAI
jgi:hypothetical protein